MARTLRMGSVAGGAARPGGRTYPGTYSGYGQTRADSIGEPVPQYAYQGAASTKAFNKQQAEDKTSLGKVQ